MDNLTHVTGKNKGNIILYALSTCIWCKKTRELLDNQGVDYFYVYLDLLEKEENSKTTEEMKKWNPKCTFPTLVINNEKCITGFKEEDIMKEIG